MNNRITHTSLGKIYQHLDARLRTALIRFGLELFADQDAIAREHDWQITSTPYGLGRRYRDPRFDRLGQTQVKSQVKPPAIDQPRAPGQAARPPDQAVGPPCRRSP
jgi:hypothetical protein